MKIPKRYIGKQCDIYVRRSIKVKPISIKEWIVKELNK
jgi:hypothetical protein